MPTQYAEAQDAGAHAQARPGAAVPQSVWKQDGLAALLALLSGYVDAYAYLSYKVYVSFMSGNTTQGGLQAGQGHFGAAWHSFLPILAFVAGVFAGTLLQHSGLRGPRRWLWALVAALLGTSLAGARLGLPSAFWVVSLSVAMGALNTAISRVGAQTVGLGYVTGSLNSLAQHLALGMRRLPVPGAQGAWDTHGRRALVLASVWAGFLLGAILGASLTPRLAAWALLAPILVLAALAALAPATGDKAQGVSH